MSPLTLPSVTVLGSTNVDIVHRVDALPAPGETVLAWGVETFVGGKGANQAAAAARLGARTSLASAIGTDAHGRLAREGLLAAGVDLRHLAEVEDRPTGTATIAVDSAGENAIIVDVGANAVVTAPPPDDAIDVLLCQLEVPVSVVEEAIQSTRARFVALNAAPATPVSTPTLQRVDLVVVNTAEWSALPQLRDHRCVVVTAGAHGAQVFEFGKPVLHVPAAVAPTVVNTVGAGDAFTAAVCVATATGFPIEFALRIAALVGADAVATQESQPSLLPLSTYAARLVPGS